ncbi:DUF3564 domain-containing protein [Paraburkholderia antibiotica]|uniref:DUF3564 domain-containing protein n=1 Tax=Paraburkholderia antibiotica TaxID=2728839 RepID=A0A7X9X5K2_9BURK|nr:DUF3564 domain-containing protein [Paraburkholderia antibiotica]NML31889.1 DUF3564 domain-containing protein [Paraburkholderia antibiotica]
MRLTVHLDTFDHVHPMAFVILWLDRDTRRWSREGHFGLDLPDWGRLQMDGGNTLVCAPHSMTPVCVLEGLDLRAADGPFEGEVGNVQWCAERGRQLMTGHWRVQCIDTEQTEPENSVFATGEDA